MSSLHYIQVVIWKVWINITDSDSVAESFILKLKVYYELKCQVHLET